MIVSVVRRNDTVSSLLSQATRKVEILCEECKKDRMLYSATAICGGYDEKLKQDRIVAFLEALLRIDYAT